MNRKPIWGIDLDGIVYKWGETARFLLNHRFGLKLGESTHWDYLKENITEEQWDWLWDDGIINHGLFRSGHIYTGSLEALDKLSKIGNIIIITSRPEIARADTLHWLAFHRIPASHIVMLHNGEPKSSVRPHCDMYVDDNVENCIDLYAHTKGEVLMWDRPWNRGWQEKIVSEPSNIKVVDSWSDVYTRALNISDDIKKQPLFAEGTR